MTPLDSISSILEDDLESLSLSTRYFSIHGIPVGVSSNSADILDPISELLSYFLSDQVIQDPSIHLYFLERSPSGLPFLPEIKKQGHLIFDSDRDSRNGLDPNAGITLKYLSWKRLYLADFGSKGALVLDIGQGLCLGFLPDPSSVHPGVLSNFIFMMGLSELLRAKELFLIHCAALSLNGQGVLAPGLTGSGKTTLSLSLLRGGFKYLSDDRPFLRKDADGLEILAFPEVIDVTEETIRSFPEVASLESDAFTKGLRKRRFWVERLYPGSIVESCLPKVMVFPNIVAEKRSRLAAISKIEAIEKLLPHSLVVLDEEIAKRQFHLLCELVEGLDCYSLDFGGDFLEVHKLIRELL